VPENKACRACAGTVGLKSSNGLLGMLRIVVLNEPVKRIELSDVDGSGQPAAVHGVLTKCRLERCIHSYRNHSEVDETVSFFNNWKHFRLSGILSI
jgi:hypothetical protein